MKKFTSSKWVLWSISVPTLLVILLYFTDASTYIRALPYYIRQQYPYPEQYSGFGKVVAFTNQCQSEYRNDCDLRIWSSVLGQRRSAFVYLPPDYEVYSDPLPLIIALHGFGSNHYAAANILPPLLDSAIQRGEIPPIVMVAPDFSLGGNGLDDPATSYDDRTGSFYINSNRGRFEDYFIQELMPWIRANFNVATNPSKVVLLGQSMGGWGAFSLGLRHPEISTILVGIYPAVDTRYSCNGNSTVDYDPVCYVPLTSDNPNRLVMSAAGGLYRQSEGDLLYTVFDSDNQPGDVWTKDLPVWQRVQAYNPTDIMRDGRYGDISNTDMYIVVGDRDEYNSDAKVMSFIAAAAERGYSVNPSRPIVPGGHHTTDFVVDNMPDILRWIGQLWEK